MKSQVKDKYSKIEANSILYPNENYLYIEGIVLYNEDIITGKFLNMGIKYKEREKKYYQCIITEYFIFFEDL